MYRSAVRLGARLALAPLQVALAIYDATTPPSYPPPSGCSITFSGDLDLPAADRAKDEVRTPVRSNG
jgi:hypothetical protein